MPELNAAPAQPVAEPPPLYGTLTLNGRPLPLDRPDAFFGVLSVLHEEAAAAARLLGASTVESCEPTRPHACREPKGVVVIG